MKQAFCILLILPLAWAQYNPTCTVKRTITTTYSLTVNNGSSCAYEFTGPVGSKINMQCSFYNQNANDCTSDIFYFATGGNFSGSYKYYCGTGTMDQMSDLNQFAVGSDVTSKTSNFTCVAYIVTPLKTGTCDCGWKVQKRIVGGSPTGTNEYPFMVALLDGNSYVVCGGTIISNKHILTTASGVYGSAITTVLVGEDDMASNTDSPSYARYDVYSTTPHPSYDKSTLLNDIAVITTQTVMTFGPTIGPACLPFNQKTTLFSNNVVVGLGWGGIDLTNGFSNKLRAVNQTVLTTSACKVRLPHNTITDKQMCTYNSTTDLCRFDAGGPIGFWSTTVSRYFLVGQISYGLLCSPMLPTVNTRITSYLDWIVSVTPGITYCKK